MGESLWAELDAWQVAFLTGELGPDSQHEALQVQTVVATLIRDVSDWQDSSRWSFPAAIVMGREEERRPGAHGDGVMHFDKSYPYAWVAVASGEQTTALQEVKVLVKRMETAARTLAHGLDLEADESGEQLQQMEIEGSRLMIARRSGTQSDQWFAVGALHITFHSTV